MHYFDLTGMIVDMMVTWFGNVVKQDHVISCDGFNRVGISSIDHLCLVILVQGTNLSSSLEPGRQRRCENFGLGGFYRHIFLLVSYMLDTRG